MGKYNVGNETKMVRVVFVNGKEWFALQGF